jgi:hypothetical protein
MNGHRKYDMNTQSKYSTIKNNEVILFAGKWKELEKENVTQNNSDSERQCGMFSSICGVKNKKKA